mgnify:CR=1 FL=1
MRIVGNNPQLSRQTQATASGAITGGKPVLVNTDGTVTEIAGSATSAGSEQVFYSATIGELHIGTTFDSNSNRVVLVYKDDTNSHYGTARVGTIDSSDNSVSFGTAVVFNSNSSSYNAPIFESSDNKVVIAIRQNGGTAVVGTVDPSDNSISFGSLAQFETGNADFTAATYDSNADRIVIAYSDSGNSSHGTAIVGTVSGTSISYGSAAVFESAEVANVAVTFDSSNNKVVIVYRDVGNSNYGTAIVGTVSGTSISFGTAVVFSSATTTGIRCTFDSNSNKVFISFDEHSGNTIKGIVGTVSGTGISFGTAVQIEPALATGNYTATGFDSSTNKVIVVYGDSGDSGKGKVSVGTISGTSVSFETPVQFNAGITAIGYNSTGVAFDSNVNRFLLAYNDSGNSQYGTTVVIQTSATNLTSSENFIGFAEDTVATGQPVTINTKGAIADNMPSLPFTITYDSKSFDHSSQDVIAEEIRFKPDGTKFYLLTNDNDIIYQYAMSTAWDISTASYESKNFNVQSQEGTPQGMAINADGSSFYICGQSRVVYQYNLTTDYDISTASYASKSFSLTTQMSSGSAWSLDFDSTGTKMYAIHSNSGTVYQYTLSSAFDVSTASYASKSFDTSSQTSDPTSIAITSDGTSLYVVSSGSDQVFKYTLSTAFDLATASYSGISLTTTSQDNFPYGVAVKTDETKLYVTGAQNDSVYQYSLSDSLTPAQTYFVQTDGTLSETADDPSVTAGTAVAGSTLIVKG